MDHERAFRDYVTRVSFSLSMSRNQVATFRAVVLDIEAHDPNIAFDKRHPGRESYHGEVDAAKAKGICAADLFVPGVRYLLSTGLIRETAEWIKENARCDALHEEGKQSIIRNWSLKHYELTEAGEHIAGLLRIAGLIPQAAANVNRKKRRRAA